MPSRARFPLLRRRGATGRRAQAPKVVKRWERARPFIRPARRFAVTADDGPRVPPWSTVAEGFLLVLRGVTFRTASRIALIVGSLLSLVNQGEVLASGDATIATGVRIVINYLIPFTVASVGYLAPFRVRSRDRPPSDVG